jgi:hypothetical protein
LANPNVFDITGPTALEREDQAWNAANEINKTDFALEYALKNINWITPRYIEEGLRWLAENPGNALTTEATQSEVANTSLTQAQAEGGSDA